MHAFAAFNENVAVVDEGSELVLFHDAVRDDFDRDSHVLVLVHGSVQVEVLDVDGHEFGVGSGLDAVEEELGCSLVGGGGADVAVVLNEVTAYGEANFSVLFDPRAASVARQSTELISSPCILMSRYSRDIFTTNADTASIQI
jgi:hypothetical protein